MEYVRIADTTELAPGQMTRKSVEGRDILLANVAGNFHAVANACPHSGGFSAPEY